ncbi:MAG: hypothetical protein PHV42_02190 [Candidatus Pacebacteria bacterium]|nr:hypothetical protein [Candidatus Paceibacterota bacterium]
MLSSLPAIFACYQNGRQRKWNGKMGNPKVVQFCIRQCEPICNSSRVPVDGFYIGTNAYAVFVSESVDVKSSEEGEALGIGPEDYLQIWSVLVVAETPQGAMALYHAVNAGGIDPVVVF